MTPSTKPEVRNIIATPPEDDRSTGTAVTRTKYLVKYWHVVSEICMPTDKQTRSSPIQSATLPDGEASQWSHRVDVYSLNSGVHAAMDRVRACRRGSWRVTWLWLTVGWSRRAESETRRATSLPGNDNSLNDNYYRYSYSPACCTSIAMSVYVCLSVCLSANIAQESHVQTSSNHVLCAWGCNWPAES